MKKIMLIGSSGAGKSTLAKELGTILDLPVYHLDSLFWKPNWVPASNEEEIKVLSQLVQNNSWIIDGNYGSTIEIRLHAADTVVFLDFSRTLCLYRVIKRVLKYRNRTRPDMGPGCNEKFDLGFLKWIWNYPKVNRPKIMRIIEDASEDKNIIILKTPKQVNEFLANINNT